MAEPAIGTLLPNLLRNLPGLSAERGLLKARHGEDGVLAWSLSG